MGLDGPVLKRVVEHQLVQVWKLMDESPGGFDASFAHADVDVTGKFSVKLKRFVAEGSGRIGVGGDPEARRLPTVPTAESRQVRTGRRGGIQVPFNQKFDHRRFSRAADGQISDADTKSVRPGGGKQAVVIQPITKVGE